MERLPLTLFHAAGGQTVFARVFGVV